MFIYSEPERQRWEEHFREKIIELDYSSDPAHDLAHFLRVVSTAKKLCLEENACWEVVVPAAWLHDYVNVAKDAPRRSQASRLAGAAAVKYLEAVGYAREHLPRIQSAIESHSFSAGLPCTSLEAEIVQDADRLDAIGAIGVARLFSVSALLKSSYYNETEPFARNRSLDDKRYALDHFFVKLFKIADSLKTKAGRKEGERRVEFMREFLAQFGREIGAPITQ